MSIKSNIKKILFLSLAIVLGGSLLILLAAAINKKNRKNCNGVEVTINGENDALFLSRHEVMTIIAPDKSHPPLGRALASFDLKKMENALLQNQWVKKAQLFFDNNGVLRVGIEERTPVARIFTVNGNSFYIDSSGKQLQLSNRATVKLPVYTSFPADKERLYGADSILMEQVRKMSPFILSNPFWMAQIGQIDITPNRTFEMIPVIGKHVIVFGDGTDYEQKFKRLLLFYRQVSTKVGLDKYSTINVAFNNQVVATKKGSTGKVDSLQALKNIQKMIEATRQMQYDTVSTMVDNNIVANAAPVPTLTILKDRNENGTIKDSLKHVPPSTHPKPLKDRAISPAGKTAQPAKPSKQPKAVMRAMSG